MISDRELMSSTDQVSFYDSCITILFKSLWRFTPQTCARQQLTSELWEEYNEIIQIVSTAYLYMRNITATEQGKHRGRMWMGENIQDKRQEKQENRLRGKGKKEQKDRLQDKQQKEQENRLWDKEQKEQRERTSP